MRQMPHSNHSKAGSRRIIKRSEWYPLTGPLRRPAGRMGKNRRPQRPVPGMRKEVRADNEVILRRQKMIESQVERHLHSRIGLIGGMCLKFTSPGTAGVPDRIIIHEGRTMFVELKRPGEKPRPLQVTVFRQMKREGAFIYVLSSKEQVDQFVNELKTYARCPNMNNYDEF